MLYRIKNAHPSNERFPKGGLAFQQAHHRDIPGSPTIWVATEPTGYGYSAEFARDDLEPFPIIKPGEFEAAIQFYASGRVTPPNFEVGTPETLDQDLDIIASGGSMGVWSGIMHIRLPGANSSTWARGFVTHTQAGRMTGEVRLLLYRGSGRVDWPRTARFMICRHHAPVTSSHHQQSRGIHNAICIKCGLDMSVDSSD